MAVRGIHVTIKKGESNKTLARSDKGAKRRDRQMRERNLKVKDIKRTNSSKDVTTFKSALDFVSTLDLSSARTFAKEFAKTRTPNQAAIILERVSANPSKYRTIFGKGFAKAVLGLFLLSAPIQAKADTMPGAAPLATNPTVKHYTEGSVNPEYTLTKTSFGIPIGELGKLSFSIEPGVKLIRVGQKNNWVTDVVLAAGNKTIKLAVGTGFAKGQKNSWTVGAVFTPKEGTTLSAKGFNLQNPDKFWGALMLEQSVTQYFTAVAEYIKMDLKDPKNFDVQLGGKFNFGKFIDNPYLRNLSLKALAGVTQKYDIVEFNIDNVIPAGNATIIISVGYQMKAGAEGKEHYGNLFIAIPFK